MKDRIQHELKKDSEEFKILPRDKSQSKQFSADWWAVFGIPTQTQDEKCYSMKNYIACIHCKTVYRYSTTFSSTNTLSTSESAIHLTQSTLSNYAFKYKPRDGSDKNVKSKCNELIVRWISNNIRPFSIVDDEGLHELLQFFYELGELLFFGTFLERFGILKSCLSVYGIMDLGDVDWVCDRGANILKFFRQNFIEPIKCYAHRLNNLLSHAFVNKDSNDDDDDDEELLSTLMNTIDQLFEESVERNRLLETINSCKILVKYAKKAGLIETIKHQTDKTGGCATSLKQESSSRWLSLYNCLTSILDNYEAISIVFKEKNKLNLIQIISKLALTQLLLLLLPLRCATRDIQNDQYPTLYLVQPFHQLLINTYSSYMKLHKFALDFDPDHFQSFCNTYPNEETEPSESVSYAKKVEILSRLRTILTNMKPISNTDDIIVSRDQEQRKRFKSLNDYTADFEDDTMRRLAKQTMRNDDNNEATVSSQDSCFSTEYTFTTATYQVSKPDEIDQYCAMKIPCSLIGKDPMLLWSQKSVQEFLPLLSRFARTIHAIPPTSASTERMFSISGWTLNNRRTNLLPSHLDDILVIRSGLRIETRNNDE
ncbi:unnamed protein product [Rotaria magnacalcarata]